MAVGEIADVIPGAEQLVAPHGALTRALAVAHVVALVVGLARRHTTVRAPDTTIAALPADRVAAVMALVARLADVLLRLAARCVVVAGDSSPGFKSGGYNSKTTLPYS